MKFIKDIEAGDHKKQKVLYEIPDNIINKEFGNIYIFKHSLETKEDNADSWLEEMLKSKKVTAVLLDD
tara:strand:+ start:130 stop:333 length:204 start_codon:yes stop_codon:yes gene_type:complete